MLSKYVNFVSPAANLGQVPSVVFSGGSAIALSLICLPFVTPAFRKVCLPYLPATTAQVENVMKAVAGKGRARSGSSLIDIGSGDGRIVNSL